jgi:hypothetical protein
LEHFLNWAMKNCRCHNELTFFFGLVYYYYEKRLGRPFLKTRTNSPSQRTTLLCASSFFSRSQN